MIKIKRKINKINLLKKTNKSWIKNVTKNLALDILFSLLLILNSEENNFVLELMDDWNSLDTEWE